MPRHGDIAAVVTPEGVREHAAFTGMTITEAARFLRVSPATVARAVESGDLPTYVSMSGVAVDGAAVLAQMRSPASMARAHGSGMRTSHRQGKETTS